MWILLCTQSYSMAVYLVKQQSSSVLLQRLRAKGIRNPDHSRALSKDRQDLTWLTLSTWQTKLHFHHNLVALRCHSLAMSGKKIDLWHPGYRIGGCTFRLIRSDVRCFNYGQINQKMSMFVPALEFVIIECRVFFIHSQREVNCWSRQWNSHDQPASVAALPGKEAVPVNSSQSLETGTCWDTSLYF